MRYINFLIAMYAISTIAIMMDAVQNKCTCLNFLKGFLFALVLCLLIDSILSKYNESKKN
jgi:hypothetical protein